MNKIKKISAIVVCTVMAMVCTINAGAAEVPEQPTDAAKYSSFKVINSTKDIPNNTLYLTTFNQNSETLNILKLKDYDNSSNSKIYSFKDYVSGDYVSLSDGTAYEVWAGYGKSGNNTTGKCMARYFNNTQGKYQKIRIKLSDFSSYFNSDGSRTHTNTIKDDTHNYYFGLPETVGDKTYYSTLIFFSGSAFTSVTPNKNGEVEIYVSTQIGESTYFTTNFGLTTKNSSGGGGGISRSSIAICKGNAKTNDSSVSIDDATHIQLYLADMLDEAFTDLQKFNADANNDGVIDIKDATYIQFYLADLL